MKKSILCALLCAVSVCSLGTSRSAFAKEFLTHAQASKVLDSFDDESSDNLDEGDCLIVYKKIACDDQSKSCVVYYRQAKCDPKSENTPKGVTLSCEVQGVSSYQDLVDSGFEKFTDCYSGQH